MSRCVDVRLGLSVVLTLVALAGCGARQPLRSFAELPQRVEPGHAVYVIGDTGVETRGTVVAVSASDLTLEVDGGPRSISASGIRQIQRYGDSLWNGLLIGAAVGAPAVLVSDSKYVPCSKGARPPCTTAQVGQRLASLALSAAIGAGIDALIKGREQVYAAPGSLSHGASRIKVSPQVGPAGGGLIVNVDLDR